MIDTKTDPARVQKVSVELWWDDARDGSLPMVCVGTGRPADKIQRFSAESPPVVIWNILIVLPLIFVFFYLVLFLGGPWPTRDGVKLPVSAAYSRRLRELSAISLLAIPMAIAFLIVAGVWRDLAWVFVALGAGSLIASWITAVIRQRAQPGIGRRRHDKKIGLDYVRLTRVHPAFAEACLKPRTPSDLPEGPVPATLTEGR